MFRGGRSSRGCQLGTPAGADGFWCTTRNNTHCVPSNAGTYGAVLGGASSDRVIHGGAMGTVSQCVAGPSHAHPAPSHGVVIDGLSTKEQPQPHASSRLRVVSSAMSMPQDPAPAKQYVAVPPLETVSLPVEAHPGKSVPGSPQKNMGPAMIQEALSPRRPVLPWSAVSVTNHSASLPVPVAPSQVMCPFPESIYAEIVLC